MAFISGKADPWGMRINPSYKDIRLPRQEWPLLDEFRPDAQPGTCRYANNDTPYLSQVAAPTTTLRKIAEALIDAWPNEQTTSEGPLAGGVYKTGRVGRQPFGQRFMLGIVSLGDAARFGLRSAALETARGTYVPPTSGALARGIELSEQIEKLGPFRLDQSDVKKDGRAYPGTMVVYTTARLEGMAAKDAATVASFVRIATTEGQEPGRSNGELPEGYLPIRASGSTAKLFAAAQDAADAIEAQDGAGTQQPPREPEETTGPGTAGPSGGGGGSLPPGVPAGAGPDAESAPTDGAEPLTAAAVPMPATQPVGSRLAGGLLPVLILLGVTGCLVTLVLRVAGPVVRRVR
ncbi:MAG: hypothetical protein WBP61_04840, partial [Nocardioides sp.]